jgi:drug/metabolite transporter (DMT)-like permease
VPLKLDRSQAAIAALVLACTIWGTAFLFGKLALQELTVSQLVLLRFGVGSLGLLPILALKGARLDKRDLPLLLLTGFLAVPVTFLLQFRGLELTTVARASLIIGAIPPLLALGSALLLGERPGRRAWLAIIASLLGVALIAGVPGAGGSWIGDGMVFLSTVVTVVWVILQKRLSDKYGPMVATAYLFLFGTITLVPISLVWDGPPSLGLTATGWLAVLILGLLCSALAFVLWNWALKFVPVSTAGVYLNLEPFIGALLGMTILGESLGPGLFLGGALILGSAFVVARSKQVTSAVGGPIQKESPFSLRCSRGNVNTARINP